MNSVLSNLIIIDFPAQRWREVQRIREELKFAALGRFETLWPIHGPQFAPMAVTFNAKSDGFLGGPPVSPSGCGVFRCFEPLTI